MKRFFFSAFYLFHVSIAAYSQSAPNLSNAAQASPTSGKAAQLSSIPVNIFTGVPGITVRKENMHP